MDCSLPGSSVHGILPARILEWVAIPFSRARGAWPKGHSFSCDALLRLRALWPWQGIGPSLCFSLNFQTTLLHSFLHSLILKLVSSNGIAHGPSMSPSSTICIIFPRPTRTKFLGSCHLPPSLSQKCSIFLTLTLLPLSFTNDTCDYIGPTWIMQDNLPISSSLINYICPWILSIRTWTYFG